ncbi:peptidoglycan recognition protein family protein [Halalkalibacter alkalisediminis]|uniref:Autolysin n=1 Tax=Halalkalibacter alkalisediminis TaxID=935616 RepID=A0ABV6NCK2_9BACI|nr:N-acetylmuramoyl-L-alanine amidase [Halalkalibacter alkalisediminis]
MASDYHEIILPDGTVQLCYDPTVITNGVAGHNTISNNICLVGLSAFTDTQEKAWEERVKLAMKRFGFKDSNVLGHKEFNGQNTACPGIDMNKERQSLKGNTGVVKEEVVLEVKGAQVTTQRVLHHITPFICRIIKMENLNTFSVEVFLEHKHQQYAGKKKP